MRSIGPSGREATGTSTVALKATWIILAAVSCCAAVNAAEPEPLRAVNLPQLRLDAFRATEGKAPIGNGDFRPAHLSIDRSQRPSLRFYDTHLIPELRNRFEGMGRVYQNLPGVGLELAQFTLHAEVTDSARHNLERATTSAVRDFFLDWTQIEERLLSIPLSKKLSSSLPSLDPGSTVRSRDRDLDLSFGISSMMPEVGLRYRLGETLTRFEVNGHGSIDVEFSRLSDVYSRIAMQYDAEEAWYGLHYRARF